MSSSNPVLKTKVEDVRPGRRYVGRPLEPVPKPPLLFESGETYSPEPDGHWFLKRALVHFANLALTFAPLFVIGVGLISSIRFWLFLIGAVCFCAGDLSRCRSHLQPDRLPQSRFSKRACSAMGLSVLLTWWIALTTSSVVLGWVSLFGFILMVSGAWLRREAILALGGDFVSDVAPGDRLCTTGVFAWFRHPSEVGLLACVLGGCVVFGSPTAVAFWLIVVIPLSLLRVRIEEVELRNRFGHEYVEYRPRLSKNFTRPVDPL